MESVYEGIRYGIVVLRKPVANPEESCAKDEEDALFIIKH